MNKEKMALWATLEGLEDIPQEFLEEPIKKMLLEMALNKEPKPSHYLLRVALNKFTNPHSNSYDPKFDAQIRQASDWFVVKKPITRREQTRQLIVLQIKETPDRSNRWIGKQLGVAHRTVGTVRFNMESMGEIFASNCRVGDDEKKYPAKKQS